MARKLRIAVSAFFGVLTLLQVYLSARSYSVHENRVYVGRGGNITSFGVRDGRFVFFRQHVAGLPYYGWRRERSATHSAGFGNFWPPAYPDGYWTAPILMFALATAFLAYQPASILRFSLRSLLIATTLLAVVLGLAVWAGR